MGSRAAQGAATRSPRLEVPAEHVRPDELRRPHYDSRTSVGDDRWLRVADRGVREPPGRGSTTPVTRTLTPLANQSPAPGERSVIALPHEGSLMSGFRGYTVEARIRYMSSLTRRRAPRGGGPAPRDRGAPGVGARGGAGPRGPGGDARVLRALRGRPGDVAAGGGGGDRVGARWGAPLASGHRPALTSGRMKTRTAPLGSALGPLRAGPR